MNVLVGVYSRFETWNIPDEYVERLRHTFPHHHFIHVRSEAEAEAAIAAADVLFGAELRPATFARARQLRWIHSPAAGVGSMLFPELRDSGVLITNSRGMSAETIAEHILALVLALFRKFPLAFRSQAARYWALDDAMQPPAIRTVAGARVLMVGLGSIGTAAAAKFAGLGATVTGVRRRLAASPPPGVTAVVGHHELRRVLPDADIVVIAAAQTNETRGIIGRGELAVMKAGAILINVSRGELVDEGALASALAQHRLAGAGLDVFEHEPLDAASPLWGLPNVIITPHMASFRADHWDAATHLFAENVRRFDRGDALLNVVDKQAGY
jgi:phosphoglycerate dehydrogenase-like enzyme